MNKQSSLSRLSDSQLVTRLDQLVQKERETTLEVIWHLIEMDRRSLYLGRDYASLFEYCTRHLGYSESALLCAKHNRLEAEKIYGKKFIDQRIQDRKPLRE